jgi:hypothetical protein
MLTEQAPWLADCQSGFGDLRKIYPIKLTVFAFSRFFSIILIGPVILARGLSSTEKARTRY